MLRKNWAYSGKEIFSFKLSNRTKFRFGREYDHVEEEAEEKS